MTTLPVQRLPSILRYARHHGLCYDHRGESVLCKLNEVDLVDRSPELPELPNFAPPDYEPTTDTKLKLNREASKLLLLTIKQPQKPMWKDLLSDHRKLQKLKVEQPLLMTDHQKDMKKFLPKRSLSIEDIEFALEKLDEENDEGLCWPSSARELRTQWDYDRAHEKLQTSRATLLFLIQRQRDTWTDADHNDLVKELLNSVKV